MSPEDTLYLEKVEIKYVPAEELLAKPVWVPKTCFPVSWVEPLGCQAENYWQVICATRTWWIALSRTGLDQVPLDFLST